MGEFEQLHMYNIRVQKLPYCSPDQGPQKFFLKTRSQLFARRCCQTFLQGILEVVHSKASVDGWLRFFESLVRPNFPPTDSFLNRFIGHL